MGQLELQNLSITYQNKPVIKDLSIKIHDGELVSLLGPSGVGKTTILKAIAGLLQPSSGKILIDGKEVNQLPADRRDAVLVFQKPLLFPFLNVAENIGFGLKMAKVEKSTARKKIDRIVEITGLQGLTHRKIHQLSGGQQQRVALARGLVLEPSLLLLDEPLSNLDAELRQQMRELISNVQAQTGTTTIFVTHDQSEAFAISQRICLLLDGRLRQTGTPKELFYQPADLEVASFFGCGNFIHGKIEKGQFVSSLFTSSTSLIDCTHAIAIFRPEEICVSSLGDSKEQKSSSDRCPETIDKKTKPDRVSTVGIVRQVRFEGSLSRLIIETENETFTALSLQPGFKENQSVYLSFPLEKVHIIADK